MSSSVDGASCENMQRLVLLFCSASAFGNLYCTQAVGLQMAQAFGLSVRGSAFLLTCTVFGLAVASPAAGWLAHRLGIRCSLVLGFTLLGLLGAALALAGSLAALSAVRALQGLVLPLVLASLLSTIKHAPSPSLSLRRATAYVAGTLCGGIAGRLLPAMLWAEGGQRAAFLSLSLLQFASALLAPRIAARKGRVDVEKDRLAKPHAGSPSPSPSLLYMAGFAVLFAQTAVFTYVAFRLAGPPFDWTALQVGNVYLVFLPSLLLVGLSRMAMDGWGLERALTAALVLSWVGLLLTAIDISAFVVSGLAMFSVAVFSCQAILAHGLSQVADSRRTSVNGRYLFFYYLGGSLGTIAPSLLWGRHGWPVCLAMIAVLELSLLIGARLAALWVMSRSEVPHVA